MVYTFPFSTVRVRSVEIVDPFDAAILISPALTGIKSLTVLNAAGDCATLVSPEVMETTGELESGIALIYLIYALSAVALLSMLSFTVIFLYEPLSPVTK